MIAHVHHDLTTLAFETHRARQELDNSVARLSSGKRMVNAGQDTGGYQQAAKLGSKHRRDVVSIQNLQNLVSYSHTQDGALQNVEKILHRMNTLAMQALDVTSTDDDRENYNKGFMELSAQLDDIAKDTFNGLDIFGAGAFSDSKKSFIEARRVLVSRQTYDKLFAFIYTLRYIEGLTKKASFAHRNIGISVTLSPT